MLKPGSVRTALQQVLFAWGACAATDGGDSIRVFPLPAVPAEVGTGRTYTGVSVETASVVTKVTVTAHTYAQSDSGSIEINGVRYSDTKTPYSVSNPNVTAADKQNVIEITEATLVSPEIGPAVAQRVYDYYLKQDWTDDGVPTAAQMARYLANVAALRAALAVPPFTPAVPADMAGLTAQEANDIEQILLDINQLLNNMAAAWVYSGKIFSGEVF